MDNKIDYQKIGFRCGIEIHQRLDTHKLFCNCDSGQKNEPNIEIGRRLRPVAGETGEIDRAALFEFLRSKEFVYKASADESCLVEADCEPPHEINKEALYIGLEMCKMLGCDIVDEVHVMRKTVIDGSNTSGFQRTAILGMNGFLNTGKGGVKIETVCIEEESARIDEKSEGKIVYRLNGLGIPLVEIATDSTIKSPEHAKEVAEMLGMLLRSTKVQRGIGSIRQDINISIRGGSRIEIKGFQELDKMPVVVENEVKRQLCLLGVKDELRKIGIKEKDFIAKKCVTDIFKKTECNFIAKALKDDAVIHSLLLPRFSGMLKKECGDKTLGKELSGYAGAHGFGIIHSDEELEKYKLYNEFSELRKEFGARQEDLVLIIAGKEPGVSKALDSVLERSRYMLVGVPEETRMAHEEGSKYMRPLPGKARMYPETDVPSMRITKEYLDSIAVPESLLVKEKKYSKEISEELASQIIRSKHLPMYEEFRKEFEPRLVAIILTNTFKMLSRDGHDIDKIKKDDLFSLFSLVKKKTIAKESLENALVDLIEGKPISYIESRYRIMDDERIREIVKDAIKHNPGARESIYMGALMQKLRGTVSGERLVRILREEMK
ncbi:MAG: Glu-tRNA(Gln) amidotransferase subunit GatE [Candidatus Aenigmarchaeota archaeon]|nr:Glu-tRNA(Gln) amidotransferase subunit GatE [Candidatus Aenigmarchaeota archaeon]